MTQQNAAKAGSAPADSGMEIPTNGEDYQRWRMTGKIEADEPVATFNTDWEKDFEKEFPVGASVQVKLPGPEQGAEEVSSAHAADSEAANSTSETTDEDDELGRLYDGIAQRDAQLEELRLKVEELSQKAAPEASVEAKTAQPAAQTEGQATGKAKPKLDDKNPDGTFKYSGDQGWAQFTDDLLAWNTEAILGKVAETQSRSVQDQQVAAQNKIIEQEWTRRISDAEKKYPDFRAVALTKKVLEQIPQHSTADHFILESAHGTDLLYYFGKHPDVLTRLVKLNPIAQAREIVHLEDVLSGKASGQQVTRAPRPPAETGGRGTVAPDEVEQAVKEGDFESYREAQNRRELAKARPRERGK